MKRILAILLILVMVLAITACNGKEEEPAEETGRTREPAETTTPSPRPSPTPAPEPSGPEMITVTLESPELGNISFSYIDDGTYNVDFAAKPNEDSLQILGDELFEKDLRHPYIVQYQRAHIWADGFNIVIGYTDYNERFHAYQTYDMLKRQLSRIRDRIQEVSYGGLDGYGTSEGLYLLAFPSISQFSGRVIAVFPDMVLDPDELEDKSRELLELPQVKAILDSLEFSGTFLNEPRFEVQPVDDRYFTFSLPDGWELTYFRDGINSYDLIKEGAGNNSFSNPDADIDITQFGLSSVRDHADKFILDSGVYTDAERLDDITINGQDYQLYHSARWSRYWLLTSIGAGPLDEDKQGYIKIVVNNVANLEVATSFLNTFRVK